MNIEPATLAILVKQAPIWGTVALVQGALLLLAIYGLYRWIRLLLEHEHDGDDDWDWVWIPTILIGVVLLILLFGFVIVDIQNIVAAFFNPEYWALKNVVVVK